MTCPCEKCGYDLRGLTFDHRCPECGTPIRESVLAFAGRFTDMSQDQWYKIKLAFIRLLIALCAGALLFLLCALLAIGEPRWAATAFFVGAAVVTFWAVVGPTKIAMGYWNVIVPCYFFIGTLTFAAVFVSLGLRGRWVVAMVSLCLAWAIGMLQRKLADQAVALAESVRRDAASQWKQFIAVMLIAATMFLLEMPTKPLSRGIYVLAHVFVVGSWAVFLWRGHRSLRGRIPIAQDDAVAGR